MKMECERVFGDERLDGIGMHWPHASPSECEDNEGDKSLKLDPNENSILQYQEKTRGYNLNSFERNNKLSDECISIK